MNNRLSAKVNYSFKFNPDSSYNEKWVRYNYRNSLSRVWTKNKSRGVNRYSKQGELLERNDYFGKQEKQIEKYSSGLLKSREQFYDDKLRRIQKYANDNLLLEVEYLPTGDTIMMEECKYDDDFLLIKHRFLIKRAIYDNEGKILTGTRREEEVSEYSYIFY